MKNKKFFTKSLLEWNCNDNKRKMPWKGEKDPYKIWISEIILQQTRVQQGLAYYQRFIKAFPDAKSLAAAPEQKVFKLWEGLGYYSRCRNLLASAKYIDSELNGKFPENYTDILALKGVGDYTASAIASFAYNQPHAVLDGNVFRVLSRFFGIKTPVDTPAGKKLYSLLASDLLDKKEPGIYNQAIMDFGAIICKPAQPLCDLCALQLKCAAFNKHLVNILPVKEKSIKRKERFFNYLIVEYADSMYVRKRIDKDIWQSLYEFILLETNQVLTGKDLLKTELFASFFAKKKYSITAESSTYKQQLTHQTITGKFFHIKISTPLTFENDLVLVTKEQIRQLAFPKFIASYLID
ncbi:MAG: A/G-specific adenine glycosylase [Bacteroidota bacterium]|nr:A/G-specific adenine glycosylase [Bacteroidota bacterium]